MANRKAVYWDSPVFLAIISGDPNRSEQCMNLFREARDKREVRIFTSAITIAECADVAGSINNHETIRDFFDSQFVSVIGADRLVNQRASNLQRELFQIRGMRISVRDAIHLATAMHVNCEEMLTYDNQNLMSLTGLLAGRDGAMLVIQEPIWQGALRMPLD